MEAFLDQTSLGAASLKEGLRIRELFDQGRSRQVIIPVQGLDADRGRLIRRNTDTVCRGRCGLNPSSGELAVSPEVLAPQAAVPFVADTLFGDPTATPNLTLEQEAQVIVAAQKHVAKTGKVLSKDRVKIHELREDGANKVTPGMFVLFADGTWLTLYLLADGRATTCEGKITAEEARQGCFKVHFAPAVSLERMSLGRPPHAALGRLFDREAGVAR